MLGCTINRFAGDDLLDGLSHHPRRDDAAAGRLYCGPPGRALPIWRQRREGAGLSLGDREGFHGLQVLYDLGGGDEAVRVPGGQVPSFSAVFLERPAPRASAIGLPVLDGGECAPYQGKVGTVISDDVLKIMQDFAFMGSVEKHIRSPFLCDSAVRDNRIVMAYRRAAQGRPGRRVPTSTTGGGDIPPRRIRLSVGLQHLRPVPYHLDEVDVVLLGHLGHDSAGHHQQYGPRLLLSA